MSHERRRRCARSRHARGHEIVAVYRGRGHLGRQGPDKRPGFNAMHKDASRRKFDRHRMVGRSARAVSPRPDRLPVRVAQPRDRPCLTSTGHRHHDARGQGHVPDDGRVCRVRTVDDRRAGACWRCRAKASGTKSCKAFGRPRKVISRFSSHPRHPEAYRFQVSTQE
jgi:hypothetical protein